MTDQEQTRAAHASSDPPAGGPSPPPGTATTTGMKGARRPDWGNRTNRYLLSLLNDEEGRKILREAEERKRTEEQNLSNRRVRDEHLKNHRQIEDNLRQGIAHTVTVSGPPLQNKRPFNRYAALIGAQNYAARAAAQEGPALAKENQISQRQRSRGLSR